MGKLIVTMSTTLDGFIANSDGGMDWIIMGNERVDYTIALVSSADTLLLGRQTYQDFTSYWPDAPDNPKAPEYDKTIARKFNAMKKFVVSNSLEQATWQDTTILRDIVSKNIEKLKQKSDKSIIYGSASVVQQLTTLGWVAE